MIRKFVVVAAVVAALVSVCQPASAGERKKIDDKLNAVSIGVGAAATAGYFALGDWRLKWHNVNGLSSIGAMTATTIGCMALSPMVATVVLNRPLTQREAGILFGDCVIPIVGGWLVNEAYNDHPEWDPAYKPVVVKKKKHAKM